MKVYNDLREAASKINRPVMTIGMYDGVHLGHQELFKQMVIKANQEQGESLLLTFDPHPREFLQKDFKLKQLTLLNEKLLLLEKLGIHHVVIQAFSQKFARKSALEFVREDLVGKLNVHHLIIGHDHHFGRNREGNFEQLQEFSEMYGFGLERLEAVKSLATVISSTKIRTSLAIADLEFANRALGRPYQLSGVVVHGKGQGRGIGFPTANLQIDSRKLIPADGVYAVEVVTNHGSYAGMMNIGNRPTFGGGGRSIEVHLFEFQGDLYGAEISVNCLVYLRPETKFNNTNELKKQLDKDKLAANQAFQEYKS